jgi:hypothetical protein
MVARKREGDAELEVRVVAENCRLELSFRNDQFAFSRPSCSETGRRPSASFGRVLLLPCCSLCILRLRRRNLRAPSDGSVDCGLGTQMVS